MLKWSNIFNASGIVLLLLVVTSCSPPVGDKRDFAESLLRSESGTTVRGSVMGDPSSAVKRRETYQLKEEDKGSLSYSGTAVYDGREIPVSLIYTFDTYGLYEIQFDIFPEGKADKERLFKALKGKLTMMDGRPDGLPNGLRFSTFSPGHNIIEVTLIDDSEDQGTPFLSLNFLEQLEDEI